MKRLTCIPPFARFRMAAATGLHGTGDVQSAFGGDLAFLFRHKCGLIRAKLEGYPNHFGSCGHFQIQPGRHRLAQPAHIAVLNMPAVSAQVDRDAVGSGQFGQNGRGYGIRLQSLAGPGGW